MKRRTVVVLLLLALAPLTGARAAEPPPAQDPDAAFRRGEDFAKKGKYKEAMTEYGAALQQYKQRRDLGGAGRTVNRIGRIHLDRGSYANARQLFSAAQKLLRNVDDAAGQAELYKNLGVLEELTGNLDQAEEYATRALALYRDVGDALGQGHCTNNLAVVRVSLARYQEALKLLGAAREHYVRAGARTWEAATLNNTAKVYLATGNYLRALALTRDALAIARAEGVRPMMAPMLRTLGSIHVRLGDPEQALAGYREALELNRADGRQRDAALDRLSLARVHRLRGDLDAAVRDLTVAREELQAIGARAALGGVETSLGAIAFQRQDYDVARTHFRAALDLARELGQAEEETKGRTFLGLVDLQTRKSKAAVRQLRQALATARELHLPERQILASELLGLAYLTQGRIDQAIAASREAIAEGERLRGALEGDDLKSGLFSRFVGGYGRLSELYLRKYRKSTQHRHLDLAFQALEKGRAQSLLEMLSQAGAEVRSGAPTELVAAEERALRDRKALQGKLKQATNEERPALAEQLASADRRLDELAVKIREQSPEYSTLRYPSAATLAEVQARLEPDEILLEYALGSGEDGRARLWAIDRRRVTLHRFDGARVRRDVPLYRATLRDPLVRGLTRARRKLLEKRLYQQLIAPAMARLQGKKRLYVVPQDELYALPFEALRTPDGGYLADRFTFLYLPSATLLVQLAAPDGRADRRPYLGVGDPVFAPADDSARATGGRLKLARLPGTADEITAAATAFGDGTVYLRDDARESTLKQLDLAGYRYLHFATHGLLGEEVDWLGQPALALNLTGDGSDDGLLTMAEVFNLELAADAVLLSACNTGRGKQVRGEGVMGLTRAFFYAGTPTVVVSLWPVSDASTARLISDFAARLAQGARVADALADARRALRSARIADRWGKLYSPYDHPFYWAPFVVLGRD